MNGYRTATEALIAKIESAHAAEVERLTAENKKYVDDLVNRGTTMINVLTAERDAAVARAERAEEALRDAASKLSQVNEYLEGNFEGTRDHRFVGIQSIIEIGLKRIGNIIAGHAPATPQQEGEGDE